MLFALIFFNFICILNPIVLYLQQAWELSFFNTGLSILDNITLMQLQKLAHQF